MSEFRERIFDSFFAQGLTKLLPFCYMRKGHRELAPSRRC